MNLNFDMAGPAVALGLSAIGSAAGCYIGGIASIAAMARTEEGHGKFIGLAAAPSSQIIYGFILMLLMSQRIIEGTLPPLSALAIGISSGTAIMLSALFQGRVCASGIEATLKDPSVFGKCFATIGIIESFALFSFVFPLLIM